MDDNNPLRAAIYVGRLAIAQAITLTPDDEVCFHMKETEASVDADGYPIHIVREIEVPFTTETLADLHFLCDLAIGEPKPTDAIMEVAHRVRALLKREGTHG